MTDTPSPPEAAQPQAGPPNGRAGRNVPAAIAVGVFLGVGLVLVPVYLFPWAFVAIIAAAVVIGVAELNALSRGVGAHPPVPVVLLGAVVLVAAAAWQGPRGLAIAAVLTSLAVLVARLGGETEGFLRDSGAGVLALLYVAVPASFGVLLALADDGANLVVAVLATAVSADIGGYLAGVFFGRHPMAPRLSPKKTWEGFAGSLLLCVVVAVGVFVLLLDAPAWQGVVFGLVLCPVAVAGDLVESAAKRDAKVKDSGQLLPGHGGLLDRIDSILLAAPVGWLLMSAFGLL